MSTPPKPPAALPYPDAAPPSWDRLPDGRESWQGGTAAMPAQGTRTGDAAAAAEAAGVAERPPSPSRRQALQGGWGWALARYLGPWAAGAAGVAPAGASAAADATPTAAGSAGRAALTTTRPGRLGFAAVPMSRDDTLVVPAGYIAEVLAPWGDPVGLPNWPAGQPAWRSDASATAEQQSAQFGMHHDGMHFYALAADRGLLVQNHEYTDEQLLHADGKAAWSAEKVAKSQAAHGISVCELQRQADGRWQIVRPSRLARRITARTPCALGGPAAGHRLMRTAADPKGEVVLGTLANCAAGRTPWGTYLSGEENWAGYFDGPAEPDADQRRYGLRREGWSRWAAHDERFDATRHPNEFHRFGWVVELDPTDPEAAPIKRTAMGRAAHEGAWVALTRDRRAVVYSGEDAAFECIYKFISRDAMAEAKPGLSLAQANRTLLDQGTLYVARFDADGRGRWLPLVHGQGPLTAANGFADQAEVLIRLRQASRLVGGTPMDRPEWLAIDPARREVYCTLTNNSQRGQPGQPGVDAANPRANNTMGQIIRWREDGDFDGLQFRWDHLMLAGDAQAERPEARGTVRGDAFGSPDGLTMDDRGLLWIQTDLSTSRIGQGDYRNLGHNQMLACDPQTGEVRRFLTGPRHGEITGAAFTPDGRTLFINVQHPGEGGNTPDQPERHSTWPGGPGSGRPRSATVMIRRRDGGLIGD